LCELTLAFWLPYRDTTERTPDYQIIDYYRRIHKANRNLQKCTTVGKT
jgi:hypothetical protein